VAQLFSGSIHANPELCVSRFDGLNFPEVFLMKGSLAEEGPGISALGTVEKLAMRFD